MHKGCIGHALTGEILSEARDIDVDWSLGYQGFAPSSITLDRQLPWTRREERFWPKREETLAIGTDGQRP